MESKAREPSVEANRNFYVRPKGRIQEMAYLPHDTYDKANHAFNTYLNELEPEIQDELYSFNNILGGIKSSPNAWIIYEHSEKRQALLNALLSPQSYALFRIWLVRYGYIMSTKEVG